jgi:hypothetical protein
MYGWLAGRHFLIVELKTLTALDDAHRRRCLNLVKVTGLSLCLPINFGTPRLDIKRVVLSFCLSECSNIQQQKVNREERKWVRAMVWSVIARG